jgi:N-hydroxyarylamine O-acetyltransferase
MHIDQYLERINYAGELHPSLDVLSQLQKTHLLHVPFENLDIHRGVWIEPKNSFDKIVVRQRGGFCYELNGLFFELLREIGFNAIMVSARVYDKMKGYGPEFDHLAIIVYIGPEPYLVDVGFGEFAMQPLRVNTIVEQYDPRGTFKVEAFDEQYKIVQKMDANGQWVPEYLFSPEPRHWHDFKNMISFHQTSPMSHFTQKRICSLATIGGRITLTGKTLKMTSSGHIAEKELDTEKEVQEALWEYFGIRW